jgi:bla regulator protein BlaR1
MQTIMENFAVNILSDDVIKALCATLLHSLWQGLILAAFAGLVVTCTRKLTPGKRYNLLIAGLVLFAIAAICTFVIQLNQISAHNNNPITFQAHAVNISTQVKIDRTVIHNASFIDIVSGYMNKHAYTIVLVWFLIVFARSLQLLTGLHGLYHLRRKAMFTIDSDWEKQVKVMADKMGIQRIVNIAESGIAKVPMVIGHLKPLILLPIGLITAMPPAEIEAILVHELAHIRRRDYLLNLLQSLMEILFFFNPAVLWLSALIRTERENCCDDIAVTQTSSTVNYIRALVSCQEYRLSAPAYAMAIKGRQDHLLARVKRLVSGSNQSLNIMEKSLLAICLVSAGFLTVAFSNAEKINKLLVVKTETMLHTGENSKKETRTKSLALKSNKIALNSSAVINPLKRAGATLADTTLTKKNKDIQLQKLARDKQQSGLEAQKTDEDKQREAVRLQKLEVDKQKEAVRLQKLDEDKQREAVRLQKLDEDKQREAVRLQKLEVDKQKEAVRLQMLEVDKQREAVRLQRLEVDKQREAVRLQKLEVDKQKEAVRLQKLESLKVRAVSDSIKQLNKKGALPARSAIPASPAGSALPATPARTARTPDYKPYVAVSPKSNSRSDEILTQMVNDGIITKVDIPLSIKLSDKEFIVNGIKQPDNIYQKYRAEYVKVTGHNGYTWYYNYDTSTETK